MAVPPMGSGMRSLTAASRLRRLAAIRSGSFRLTATTAMLPSGFSRWTPASATSPRASPTSCARGLWWSVAGTSAAVAGYFYLRLDIGRKDPRSRRLVYRREYGIFYAISALFGIRKQIFMVFGTWVLVSLHGVPVSTIALLYFIGSALGVVVRPLLGDVIDWLGERTVLAVDELLRQGRIG